MIGKAFNDDLLCDVMHETTTNKELKFQEVSFYSRTNA